METAPDAIEAKRVVPKYVTDLWGQSVAVQMILDRHFPDEGSARGELVEVVNSLNTLGHFQFGLWRSLCQVDEIRRLTLREQVELVGLSTQLEKVAATCEPESQGRKACTRAAVLLQLWFELCQDFDRLRETSEQLRYAVQPERPA